MNAEELSLKQRDQLETYEETKNYPPPNGGLPEGATVFMGQDQLAELEKQNANKIQLPSLPSGILEWNEQEQNSLMYSQSVPDADMDDMVKRMQFKLSWVWQDWDALRNNKKLVDAVNNIAEDPNSEEHFIKQILVLMIDRLGKILGQTPIVEELTFKTS